jgi:hypothetical protein
VHDDDDVWPWYGNEKPGFEQARQRAKFMGESWDLHGVHKWIAYDRASGEVVGRGGLSRTPVDDDWGQQRPRGASRGVVHRPAQRAFARRHGAHRHAVRG